MAIQLVDGFAEPVYGLFACLVFIQGAAPQTIEDWLSGYSRDREHGYPSLTPLPVPPPGRWAAPIYQRLDQPMQGRFGAEVAFTHRAGRHWIRRATGALEELDTSPILFLYDRGVPGPYDWVSPSPAE